MATTQQFQERVRRAVREALQKILAEGDLPEAEDGEARFTTIESLALAAGDAVSLEVFEQQLAESGMGPPHCPRCGFEGQRSQATGSHAANATRSGSASAGTRVLLPWLPQGFFSLGPKLWVWTWIMTTARRP